jgi:hypothetical protein
MKAVVNDPVKVASLGIEAFETRRSCGPPILNATASPLFARRCSPFPRGQRLAKITCQQVGRPIAFLEFQVADDRLDGEPFLHRQFVPRHLQIDASPICRSLDEKRRITPGRPAEDYLGFIDSLADEFLGQLAGSERAALVDLVRILARKRSPPIGTPGP